MPSQYKIIKSQKEIEQLVGFVKETGYCSLDFETTDFNYANKLNYPTILGISFQIGGAYIIPLGHFDSPFKKDFKKILKYLNKELFMNPDIIKIAWNMKFEHKWLMRYGCDFKGKMFDGMLAKYLLNEERPNDLKSMVSQILPEFADYEDEVNKLSSKLGWDKIPLDILSEYCAKDCDATLRLMCYFEGRLIKGKFYNLFRNLLMPASRVLAKSEFRGMNVNVPYLDKLIEESKKKLDKNESKLRNHIKVKEFEKAERKTKTNELITSVKKEISELSKEEGNERKIKSREEKISRYLVGEFTNNKDRKLLEPFNFNSPAQLIKLFFQSEKGFKFPIVKYTTDKFKRPTSNPSTDEEVLLKLQNRDKSGFIKKLLTHREISKLYSTYMVGTRELVDDRGKVHPNFLIHGTVTGRLSCIAPNLQNIPRDTTSSQIKKMFTAPKRNVILQVDYSQAELRVMAEMADEKSMLEWFNTGKDIHLASACKKYNVSYNKALKIYENEKHKDFTLWKKRRKQAKTINFGIIYCQTAKKLATSLSEPAKDGKEEIIVTEEEAQKFLNQFNKDFPNVIKFMQKQKRFVKEKGYVRNLFGRKRRLPNIYSSEIGKKMEAERQSINAPVQGSASDFALFSSVLIEEYVKNNNKHKWNLKQMYTVHDSLGFMIDPKYIHEAVPVIRKICQNPQTEKWFGFKMKKVKMEVDFEIGVNWGNLKKYNTKEDYTKLLSSN